MAGTIEGRFLGTPTIFKDGKEVFFTYNKVNALVYYILIKGSVMRDELSGLLWGDKPDTVARKNLRNAIYEAKKVLGADALISPRKAIIQLNPNLDVRIDVQEFEKNPAQHLHLYKGEFLQGFYTKDSADYERWYLNERSRLQSLYAESVSESVEKASAEGDYALVERYGRELINYNPYDEHYYAFLLQAYCERGKIQQAMALYEDMKDRFRKDLNMNPPSFIEGIMSKVIFEEPPNPLTLLSQQTSSVPLGRKEEMEFISSHMWTFLKGKQESALMIVGDTGSGKTSLKDGLLEMAQSHTHIIQTHCYKLEQQFLLHPWITIIEGLLNVLREAGYNMLEEDLQRIYRWFPQIDMNADAHISLVEIKDILKIDAIFHTLAKLLDEAAKEKPLVLVIEDIHWMDPVSLSLLSSFVLRQSSNRIYFLLTGWDSKEKDYQHFLTTAAMYKRLTLCKLEPLTTQKIRALLETSPIDLPITDELVERMQEDTGGNLFFLAECIDSIVKKGNFDTLTTNMEMIFKSSWLQLSHEEEKILTFISLFYNGAPLPMISEYMQLDNLALLDRLEALEAKHLLTPVNHATEILYKIKQHKMNEFIHNEISPEKWKILHAYLGQAWEKRLTQTHQDIHAYQHLVYHFEQAGDLIKMGTYKLKSLTYYLNFSHELFPVISVVEPMQANGASYFTESDTLAYIADIDEMMDRIRGIYGETLAVQKLDLTYLHLKGRYFIREGAYEKGVKYIKEVIEQATELHENDYALLGYKQMIYYHIQTGKAEEMTLYIERALDLAAECNYHKEIGILLRLKGLNMIMRGQFDEAEKLLHDSINTFMVTANVARRYSLNIAAAYNYLGEIHRSRGEYEEALAYYDQAMETCAQQQAYSSWAVFCCNAGVAAYYLGKKERAREYFQQASELFSKYDFYWRRPIVEAYLALLSMEVGDEKGAKIYLEKALKALPMMNNPQEIGYVYMIIVRLKMDYPHVKWGKSISKSVESYGEIALAHLDDFRDALQKEELKSLLKNR